MDGCTVYERRFQFHRWSVYFAVCVPKMMNPTSSFHLTHLTIKIIQKRLSEGGAGWKGQN